ncbi:MAG: RNA polymerase sigma factor [Selenomonas sp.]|uniref:RNA polymerase sigma factor n=1 Tax=Selenomonas sp. TaxID=2053611 RepID=UPI0025F1A9BB|nr:RNA polymerase sigma factor [Selenomonas sp.]MCR5758003.1 RNA polymerase sigma factor [Selenomonas sp.]
MEDKDWNAIAQRAVNEDLAFDELYEHFFPKMYNLIYARVKNAATADDIVCDVFEKMVTHLADFDSSRASFATWLSRIAMRTLTDYYRWQSHRQNVEWDDVFSPSVNERERPEGQLLAKEGKSELLSALGKLSEREQRIIELKFWGEMSNKEIAETLEISSANVGVILFRAMGALRKILGEP